MDLGRVVAHSAVVPQLAEVGLSELGVAELLVDDAHELGILDEISGLHPVLVHEILDLVGSQVEIEEAECGSKGGDELVLDAVALAQFIIVLEEGFDADLLLPDLSPYAGLDTFDGGGAVDGVNWVAGWVRVWVAACLKMEVISYILLLFYLMVKSLISEEEAALPT